jgi:hypothetical protein
MVLAPTLLLNSGSGAIVRPTFSRDFAGEKTLNNGTGPSITFTRASDATYFDANGTLQTATSDTPRFDHSGGSSLGLLIEEARTNSIRNSQAGGASAGVGPTHWTTTATGNNVTRTIVGSGTENGLTYLEIQYAGTNSGAGGFTIAFDSPSLVVAADGQTWTTSAFCKLQAGSLAGITAVQVGVDGRSAAGAELSPAQRTMTTFTPTGAALGTQRVSVTRTMAAGAERAFPFILVNYTGGVAIDITLRIAAPQLEQGAFPTSYIPTTSAAVTRQADSAVVTPISSFYNQSEGTLFAEASNFGDGVNTTSVAFTEDNNTNERFQLRVRGGGLSVVAAGAISAGTSNIPPATNVASKKAGAAKLNDFAISTSGAAAETDPAGNMPNVTHLVVGALAVTLAQPLNGHIRKIAYWPRRLSNALLQQLTT